MNAEVIMMTAGYRGIKRRTLASVEHATRVHVAIECWIEDRFLFDDYDTSNQLAAFVMKRTIAVC